MPNRAGDAITQYVGALRAEGATGIEQYQQKLRDNAKKPEVLCDLLLEGRAALMFLRNGFRVTMRESPDLQVALGEEAVYVEVTHFREKGQDRVDEKAMLETTELLRPYGDLVESEGAPAWTQIANKAADKAKLDQYKSDAPNLLVVESSSPSLELVLGSAMREYDQRVLESNDLRLRRLSGIMLVQTDWIAVGEQRNVDFCPTARAATPLGARMIAALSAIRTDLPQGESGACTGLLGKHCKPSRPLTLNNR